MKLKFLFWAAPIFMGFSAILSADESTRGTFRYMSDATVFELRTPEGPDGPILFTLEEFRALNPDFCTATDDTIIPRLTRIRFVRMPTSAPQKTECEVKNLDQPLETNFLPAGPSPFCKRAEEMAQVCYAMRVLKDVPLADIARGDVERFLELNEFSASYGQATRVAAGTRLIVRSIDSK